MTRWSVNDDVTGSGPNAASLFVSLNFLKAALRRRWRSVACGTGAGLVLALAALVLLPPSSAATTSLVLAHPDGVDPTTAMATDVSLLRTRTVARDAIVAAGLSTTPDDLQSKITVATPTPEIMTISLKATTSAEALRGLRAVSAAYLAFRADQVRSQSVGAVTGDQGRIKQLQQQVATLTSRYDLLSRQSDAASQAEASDVLSKRSQLESEITTLQQDIQQTTLSSESIVVASHTVDAPAIDPPAGAKRMVLIVFSGVFLGTSAGAVLVVFSALLSNRLRRRDEVALALGRPVRFSAGVHRSWLPWRGRLRRRDLEVLAAGLATTLTGESTRQRVALVSVGATEVASLVVTRLAEHLVSVGVRVCVVDLSEAGRMTTGRTAEGYGVLRPTGVVAATTGPLALVSAFSGEPRPGEPGREEWSEADVVLVLGDAELGLGAGPLSAWADQAVLLVRSGRASAEFLDSVSRVFEASGLGIDFAMLVGADTTDESPGFPAALARDTRVSRSS